MSLSRSLSSIRGRLNLKGQCHNIPPVSLTPVANNWINIRLQTPESELEGKNLYICFLYYPKVTK
jgi:hypothetical protein